MIYFLLPAMPAASFCQKTNDSVQVVKTDYLTRSKNQKTAAWILLGGGTALIGIVSLLVIVSNLLLMTPLQALLLRVLAYFRLLAAFLFLLHREKTKEMPQICLRILK